MSELCVVDEARPNRTSKAPLDPRRNALGLAPRVREISSRRAPLFHAREIRGRDHAGRAVSLRRFLPVVLGERGRRNVACLVSELVGLLAHLLRLPTDARCKHCRTDGYEERLHGWIPGCA